MIENTPQKKSADILLHLGPHERIFSFQKDVIRDLGFEYNISETTLSEIISGLRTLLYERIVTANKPLDDDAFDIALAESARAYLFDHPKLIEMESSSNPLAHDFFNSLTELDRVSEMKKNQL